MSEAITVKRLAINFRPPTLAVFYADHAAACTRVHEIDLSAFMFLQPAVAAEQLASENAPYLAPRLVPPVQLERLVRQVRNYDGGAHFLHHAPGRSLAHWQVA